MTDDLPRLLDRAGDVIAGCGRVVAAFGRAAEERAAARVGGFPLWPLVLVTLLCGVFFAWVVLTA